MNFATLKATCRELGMTARKRDGEYRIAFADLRGEKQEASAYYTTDILDAYDTAGAMASERQAQRGLEAFDAIMAGEY